MATASARLTDEALRDVQGFIASGYGHLPSAAYLFVRVNDAAAARRWIGKLAGLDHLGASAGRSGPTDAGSSRPAPSTSRSLRRA